MRDPRCAGMIAAFLCLAGCSAQPEDEDGPAPTATVVTEVAAAHSVQEYLDVWGRVAPAPSGTQIVVMATEVQVAQVLVEPGQTLAAGQALLRVRASAASALELSRAATEAIYAGQAQQRVARLFAQQLATNADVAQAREALALAQANLASLRARSVDGEQLLRAQAAGLLVSIDVTAGAILPAGTPLAHIASSALQARLGIEPAALNLIHAGLIAKLYADRDEIADATGHVTEILSQVDPDTRLCTVLVDIKGSLRPGSLVRARIELAERADVITVPHEAVLYDADERPFLYVLRDGLAKRTAVEIGQDQGERIEIESGLLGGEQVVVEGNYVLEDGMAAVVAGPMNGAQP